MLYSEMGTHREGANKRLGMIIHCFTIGGKTFCICMTYHWNWQLLLAYKLSFHSVMESHDGDTWQES